MTPTGRVFKRIHEDCDREIQRLEAEVAQLTQARDMVVEEREAWKTTAERLREIAAVAKVGIETFVAERDAARAEIERLRAQNERLSAMVVAGFAMYDDSEARDVVDAAAIARPIMVLTSENERLRAEVARLRRQVDDCQGYAWHAAWQKSELEIARLEVELAATREVIEAAREYVAGRRALERLIESLARLDATTGPRSEPRNWRCTNCGQINVDRGLHPANCTRCGCGELSEP